MVANQSRMEKERQRRICVAIWAYAYEYLAANIVDDATFDRVCREIDVSVLTNHPEMDAWFKKEFSPDTGQWIGSHPYKEVIRAKAINFLTTSQIPYTDDKSRQDVSFDEDETTVYVTKVIP